MKSVSVFGYLQITLYTKKSYNAVKSYTLIILLMKYIKNVGFSCCSLTHIFTNNERGKMKKSKQSFLQTAVIVCNMYVYVVRSVPHS